jgi:hypothetical protein
MATTMTMIVVMTQAFGSFMLISLLHHHCFRIKITT